jgi:hypothetical protein
MTDSQVNSTEASDLQKELEALAQRQRNWVEIGLLINKVEKNRTWESSFPKFTAWLDKFSQELKVSRSSLWKYRAGVSQGMTMLNLSLSDPPEIIISKLSKVQSDVIETLYKIFSVAPPSVAAPIIEEVFSGKTGRVKLRNIWDVYRGSLEVIKGKRVHTRDVQERGDSLSRASLTSRLVSSGPDWLPQRETINAYKIVADISCKGLYGETVEFDCVAIVKKRVEDESRLELHGIFVANAKMNLSKVASMGRYCNFLWILVDRFSYPNPPVGIGLLRVEREKVSAIQMADESSSSPFTDRTAAELLQRVL